MRTTLTLILAITTIFSLAGQAAAQTPSPTVYPGVADNEQPFAAFGRIFNTVTSARQIQLGARVVF